MPFERAAHLMILQNRMGLGIIFAAKSGLCGVIATSECCMYWPSIDSNLSSVVKHNRFPNRYEKTLGPSPGSLELVGLPGPCDLLPP